jgi:acyl-CoA thioesterase I
VPASASRPRPRSEGGPRVKREWAFDPIYPSLARQFGNILYPFILDGVALDPKLNQADGIHPNAAGVKVIVGRMLPYVEKLVAEVRH